MISKAQDAWNKIALLTILDKAYKGAPDLIDNFAIQKLSFLTELQGRRANLNAAYYRFFRYTWGPYSAGVANDIRHLENFGFLDPESRELTERARYLCRYVQPEVASSELAGKALDVAAETSRIWGSFRGWHIVDKVYAITVPVDGLGGREMTVKEIPIKTDILVPDFSEASDVLPFSAQTVDDIQAELSIPAANLDDSNEFLWQASASSLDEIFNS